ncbi:MAG: methyltransferase domain-containing protein [Acidobacteria bacterium]|nr:methyltransferase domain-containing protein [Acidobacteriota bacterium]
MTRPPPPPPEGYADRLAGEAAFWGGVARDEAATHAPDWEVLRSTPLNRLVRGRDIDALLASVHPDMRVLELGCGSGWLSVALARRGARVVALDASREALAVAERYHASVAATLPGSLRYLLADLNRPDIDAGTSDLVVAVGVLHHLLDAQPVLNLIDRSLRPGGRLWVSDFVGHDSTAAALAAGAVLLMLPSEMAFRQKWHGLMRFGLRAPDRVRASMEAEGLSPMEGAGRRVDWIGAIGERFAITETNWHPAIAGYLACQIALPPRLAAAVIKAITAVDRRLVALGAWRGSGVTLTARKRGPIRSP